MKSRVAPLPLLAFLVWSVPALGVERGSELESVLRPARRVQVSSAAVGLLESVEVERGDRVRAGQVLARLDSRVERADLELVQARAESTTAIEVAETQLERSRTRCEQAEELHAEGIVSAEQLDEFRTELRLTELGLRNAREQHAQARLELERALARLEQRTVRSPVDGVVVERHLSAGELVDRSENAVVLELAQLDPLHVDVRVPQSLLPSMRVGGGAIVHPESPIDRDFRCAIQVVDPVVDAASGTFRVRLVLPNPDHAVPAGLRCSVRFLEE